MENNKKITEKKLADPKDVTTCEATAEMLAKARIDGVAISFDRAADMKACPIGKDSACCKHCAMGPCRLNAKDPYGKVGVCGATIDTIMARNFARMVAAGTACHNDHGMAMLEVFRDVVNGDIDDYSIKDPIKLEEVAAYFFRRRNVNRFGKPRTWPDDLLWHQACHMIDFIYWLFDEPDMQVWGQAGPNHPELDIPMDISIGMRSRQGCVVTAGMSFACNSAASSRISSTGRSALQLPLRVPSTT